MQKARRSFFKLFVSGNYVLVLSTILMPAFLGFGAVQTIAQKKKVAKRTPSKTSRTTPTQSNTVTLEPPSKYAFVVEIDNNENVKVTVENIDGTPFRGETSFSLLSDFFTQIGNQDPEKVVAYENFGAIMATTEFDAPDSKKKPSKPLTQKLSFADVIIKPQPGVPLNSIVDLARAAQNSTMRVKIKISETGADPYLFVPRMILAARSYNPILKPNPNTLVVFLDNDGNIRLNMDEKGTINDLTPLTQILKKIFEDREARGVLRENSNEVETTVYIKATRSTKFSDLAKLAKAVKDAGASPVGLQVDNLSE